MKTKRLLALALAAVMIMCCFASCRTKDEAAYTFNYQGKTVNIKTALYMCFLIDADLSFKDKAVEKAEADGTKYDEYTELKYEDKDYETWTKDEAKKSAQKYAYAEIEFERLGNTLSDDEKSYIDSYAEQQWTGSSDSGGVQEVYEANGISLNTFKEYFANVYYKQEVVYNFYVEEVSDSEDQTQSTESSTQTTTKKLDPEVEKLKGSLRPSDDKIESALSKNFVAVDAIEMSFTDDSGNTIDDDTKATYLKLLKNYKKKLEKGTDFETVYSTYKQESGLTSDSSSSSSTSDYAKVIMSAEANKAVGNGDEADENFNDVYKMKVNEVKILENDDNYRLVVRKDILKEKDSNGSSYKDSYSTYAISVLVKDKYESDIVEKAFKDMKVETNSSAIKFYSPKKIDYLLDTTASTTAAAQ